MAATVENISQSPLAIHVKGAAVRIEAGAQAVIDDVKAFAKAAADYIEAGELRFVKAKQQEQKQPEAQANAAAAPDAATLTPAAGNEQADATGTNPEQKETKE